MNRIIKIILSDIIRNKIVLAYTLILSILSWSSFALEDNSSKGLLTILNVILFTVPLVSILFATIYLYNSAEFIELLLSQPIKRRKIWLSLFFGLSTAMVLAFFIGAGIPLLVNSPDSIGFMMLLNGCLISIIFVALAFLSSILTRDKAKATNIMEIKQPLSNIIKPILSGELTNNGIPAPIKNAKTIADDNPKNKLNQIFLLLMG